MIKITMELDKHQIPLTLSARTIAERFSRQYSLPKKARQVYLNTLAVFAVNTYLQYLGWVTNLEDSDSWNLLMQALLDTGELKIPGYGSVECLPVVAEDRIAIVPEEVPSDRIVYLVVEIPKLENTARLLGFVPNVSSSNIALGSLSAIAKLPDYLEKYGRDLANSKQLLPKLSNWLQGKIEAGWQTLDTVAATLPNIGFQPVAKASNFRMGKISQDGLSSKAKQKAIAKGVSRIKIWNLGNDSDRKKIALVISLSPTNSEELEISVKVCPTIENSYLPAGLVIKILDEIQQPILQAKTKSTNENIEFFLSGEAGEDFSIQAILDNETKVESFII